MRRVSLSLGLLALALPCVGQAQDATLTVYMRAGGGGFFHNNNGGLTQIKVTTTSSVAAMYNGPTNIVAPTALKVPVGSTFSVEVPRLYSPMAAPGNRYTLTLEWPDTTRKTLSIGPFTLQRGANNVGAGGINNTTPIEVVNAAPPAAANVRCYPTPPDPATNLYVYWSFPAVRPVDFKEFQFHRSTSAGFTPSAATLVTTLAYGTSQRTDSSRSPNTSYYYCIRTVDSYDHVADACSAACTTTVVGGMVDLGGLDLADPPPIDLGTTDLAGEEADGAGAVDLGIAPAIDLTGGQGIDPDAHVVADPDGGNEPGQRERLSGGGNGCAMGDRGAGVQGVLLWIGGLALLTFTRSRFGKRRRRS